MELDVLRGHEPRLARLPLPVLYLPRYFVQQEAQREPMTVSSFCTSNSARIISPTCTLS